MRVEYINPFISAVRTTFRTMLSSEAERGEPYLRREGNPTYPISGVIGLSGEAIGTVVVNLAEEVALKAAEAMLQTPMTEINPDVIDAVGELTNVIAGAAKCKLEEFRLMISLPNVVTGLNHGIYFPSNVHPICVPFTTAWGPLVLEVGLTPVPKPAELATV